MRGLLDRGGSPAEDLATALGREKLSVVAVSDPGFVKGIEKIGF